MDVVAADPTVGAEPRGTGGCRKFRFHGRGKGKSGGFRIVYFYSGNGVPILLLTVFGKNQKSNITSAEATALAVLAKRLVDAHRLKIAEVETKR